MMKLEERENGVLAFVDRNGRKWAQCAKAPGEDEDLHSVIPRPMHVRRSDIVASRALDYLVAHGLHLNSDSSVG